MSEAVHRSERHGSINWRRKGGEGMLHHTVSKAKALKLARASENLGWMVCLLLTTLVNKRNCILKKHKPSPRDQ